MQHDNKVTRNVAEAALKIMMGEEPDNQQFTKEVEKAKTKASEKKSPEDEARVAAAGVTASVNMPESGVKVTEELKGGQKNIDMNKNNKIDAEDFKMLRAKKKPAKRTVTIDKPDRLVSMKVSKEEVEQIDELSPKTLGSYTKRAAADMKPTDSFLIKPDRDKQRQSGIKRAADRLVKKATKEEVEQIDEVEVLPKGVTRHKAKLAMGAKYGASDYGRGGEEEQEMRKSMTRKTEPKKRGSYGARQNIVRGTRVSGKDVNEDVKDMKKVAKELAGASKMHKKQSERVQKHVDQMGEATFFDKLTLLEEAPLEAISLSLQEGRMKDMVTHHMDAGHSYDSAVKKAEHDAANMPIKKLRKKYGLPTPKKQMSEGKLKDIITGHMTTGKGMSYDDAVKKAQADMNKMKKPKQMSSPLSKQKANEEYEQLDEKKHKKKHSCAEKVKSEEYGIGYCIPEMHTMLEDGTVTHYDVEFEDCIVENYPVSELKILKEAMHEHYDNEEKNQLHELSPKTLGSYAKKAQRQTMNTNMAIGASTSNDPITRREKAFAKKRKEGASRAIGKLVQKKMSEGAFKDIVTGHMTTGKGMSYDAAVKKAEKDTKQGKNIPKTRLNPTGLVKKEEYEQLDELSPKTLGSYAQKSVRDLEKRDKAMGKATQRDREVVNPETSKPFQKMAKRRSGLTKAINRLSKEDILAAAYDEIEQLEEGTPTKKQVKQGIGIARDKRYAKGNMSGAVKAMDKVNKGLAQHPAVAKELRKQNEDIEQIDELSPKTLGDYATKAGGDLARRSYKMGVKSMNEPESEYKKDFRKVSNRQTGLARAAHKLVDKGRKMKGGVPESVEYIDELDTKTLMSYRDKAEDDQVDRAMDMKGNTPKARKRAMGIEKAKGRLQMKAQLYGGRPGQSSYKGGHLNPVKKEEVEYIVEKNVPNNPKLWSRAKSLAKQKFDVYPSAYANGWAARWYKSKGGTWRKGK